MRLFITLCAEGVTETGWKWNWQALQATGLL